MVFPGGPGWALVLQLVSQDHSRWQLTEPFRFRIYGLPGLAALPEAE
jgi:hypothetical protein